MSYDVYTIKYYFEAANIGGTLVEAMLVNEPLGGESTGIAKKKNLFIRDW